MSMSDLSQLVASQTEEATQKDRIALEGSITLTYTPTQPWSLSTAKLLTKLAEDFREMAAQRLAERHANMNAGFSLISKAKEQGIITEDEHLGLWANIAVLGALVVPPSMRERLSQVNGEAPCWRALDSTGGDEWAQYLPPLF